MKKFTAYSALMIFIVIFQGCSGISNLISQTNSYFIFQNVRFRIGAAHEAFIGSIGLMRTEGKNRYELKFTPRWDNLALKNTVKFDNDLRQAINQQLGIKVEPKRIKGVDSNAGISAKLLAEDSIKGKFHILRIVDTKALVDELNSLEDQEILKYIARNKDYRIVTSIIVVYDHKASQEMDSALNLNLKLKSDQLGNAYIDATSGRKNVATLSMSDGSIYAYEYSRFCWEKDSDFKVADILLDRPTAFGDASACPPETTHNLYNMKQKD